MGILVEREREPDLEGANNFSTPDSQQATQSTHGRARADRLLPSTP